MSLNEVKKEILNNAEKEANKILKQGEDERKKVLDVVNTRISEIKSELDTEVNKTLEQYKVFVTAEANSIVKKQRLNMEKELISEVFTKALDNLSNLSKSERSKHVKKLLSQSKEYSKVYCSEKELSSVKNALKIEVLGGVVLEDKSSEVRLDLSYETLMESVKQENLTEVAKILF